MAGEGLLKSLSMLAKELKKEPGYDNDNLFTNLHKQHGEIFKLQVPGRY